MSKPNIESAVDAKPLAISQTGLIAVECLPGKQRGVVAIKKIHPGALIERAPVIVLSAIECATIRETRLRSYYFEWGEDDTQAAIALGFGSLYNHSYTPNARFEFIENEHCINFIAITTIEIGEEVLINYNNLGKFANWPMDFQLE